LLGNGDGTFRPGGNLSLGLGSVVVADLNGDGELDLAGLTPGDMVSILRPGLSRGSRMDL